MRTVSHISNVIRNHPVVMGGQMRKYYQYIFADGYEVICGRMSKQELRWEEYKHGQCLSIKEY